MELAPQLAVDGVIIIAEHGGEHILQHQIGKSGTHACN